MENDLPNTPEIPTWQARLALYKVPLILAFVSLFSIGTSILLLAKLSRTNEPIRFVKGDALGVSNHTIESAKAIKEITIDVAGGVERPGVYRVTEGSRVIDGVKMAGGFSKEADAQLVAERMNLAATLKDGIKIYIPKRGESNANSSTSHNNYFATQPDELQNLGTLLRPEGGSQDMPVISINSSSQSELEALPGIGPVTAKKIIDNRPYGSIEDLLTRKVVGQSVFGKIKEKISL